MTSYTIEIDTELVPHEFEARMYNRLLAMILGIKKIRIEQR